MAYLKKRSEELIKFLRLNTTNKKIIIGILSIFMLQITIPFIMLWYLLPILKKKIITIGIWFTMYLSFSLGALRPQFIENSKLDIAESTIISLVLGALLTSLFFLIFLLFKKLIMPNKAAQVHKQALKEAGVTIEASFKHINGLPIAEDNLCGVLSYNDKYEFNVNGLTFTLLRDKVTDICIKSDVDIQKQYVSSIGGAVAGGVLFGPLGAIIGGRAKEKEITTRTYYLIFTYTSDNEIKYISFDIFYNMPKALALTKEFNKIVGTRKVKKVDL